MVLRSASSSQRPPQYSWAFRTDPLKARVALEEFAGTPVGRLAASTLTKTDALLLLLTRCGSPISTTMLPIIAISPRAVTA